MVSKSWLPSITDKNLSKLSWAIEGKNESCVTKLALNVQCEYVHPYSASRGNPIKMTRNGISLQSSNFPSNDLADFAETCINWEPTL